MESVIITPNPLNGTVTVPPSKSAAHRNIICAALCCGVSKIYPSCHSDDIDRTLDCITALGASVEEKENAFYITGIDRKKAVNKKVTLNCGESGSTLRFMLPIAAALGANATFTGAGRLPGRPITPLTDILKKFGVECSSETLPLTISGKLRVGQYQISGNISSQYLTGLIFAVSVNGGSVKLTTPLQSAGYVDLTVNILKDFGVNISEKDGVYTASGKFAPMEHLIEGDWSQACFFLAAAALGGSVNIKGLCFNSAQGDMSALKYFKMLGADMNIKDNILTARESGHKAVSINCSQIPDMVPALAVTAALCKGKTKLYGAERLRIKESDRIKTVVSGLLAMGIEAEELPDGMIITGGTPKGGIIDGANDHRIVMAFAILAAYSEKETTILGYKAINKSYPAFFEDFNLLGGKSKCHQQ